MNQLSNETNLRHYHHTFEGKIVQLIPHETLNLLLVTTYCDQFKRFQGHLMDLEKLDIIKSLVIDPEYQGLNIKAFDQDKLVMMSFSNHQNPDISDVLVFDWESSFPIQEFPSIKLRSADTHQIIFDHPTFVGKLMTVDLSESSQKHVSTPNQIVFPQEYLDSSEYFQWFIKLCSPKGYQPTRQVEYMKREQFLIISTYLERDGSVHQVLLFFDVNGAFRSEVVLNHQANKLSKDSFFSINDNVLFVKELNNINLIKT